MGRRRGRTIAKAVAGAVVAVMCVMLFLACTPMTREYWAVRPELQSMLADRGEVSASIVERNINVMPRCTIDVTMREGVGYEDYAEVLGGVGEALGRSECEVWAVRLPTRSEVSADDWNEVTPEDWAVVAERAYRVPQTRIRSGADGRWRVSLAKFDGAMSDGVGAMGELIDGAPLESTLGATEWELSWHGDGSPFQDIELVSDATPSMEVVATLQQIARIAPVALRWSEGDRIAEVDDDVIGMIVTLRTVAGVTSARVDLSVVDWSADEMAAHEAQFLHESRAADLAAAILDAVESSGLRTDTVRVVANNTLVWGDPL